MPTIREAIGFLRANTRCAFRLAAALGGAGATVCLALACLPDLETNPPHAAAPPVSNTAFCGNGVIELGQDGGEDCDPGDAGAVGCTTDCKIACEGVARPGTQHCYFTVPAVQYPSATQECRARGNAHVVTLNSEDERDFVMRTFATDAAPPLWVGLLNTAGVYSSAHLGVEPGWQPKCPGCFVHPPGAGEIAGDGGPCVGDAPDASSWFTLDCQSDHSVVCEREPPGASIDLCTGGFCVVVPRTHAAKRYLFVPVLATADEAMQACAALGANASLALFDSQDEREEVFAAVQSAVRAGASDNGIWIGLAKSADASGFKWDDGKNESERPAIWGPGQPSASAADARAAIIVRPFTGTAIDVDLQLARALPGSEQHAYVCQYGW